MTPSSTPKATAPAAVLLAALAVVLAGCTAGTTPTADDLLGDKDGHAVLYLNLTVGDQTYRYTSDDATASDASAPGGNATASATPGQNGTVRGNATSGNTTAQGNATANGGSATGHASMGNGTGDGGPAAQGLPSGDAPLNVTVELGASGLDAKLPVNWTLDWGGGAARTSGGDTSASAGGNGTAAMDTLKGTSLPAHASHTFATPGRHTLVFALPESAGKSGKVAGGKVEHADAHAAVQQVKAVVAVTEGATGPKPGPPLGNETQTFTGSFPLSDPITCMGSDQHDWHLNATVNGTKAVVRHITVDATSDGIGDIQLTLKDANGTEVASGPSIDEDGPFPPGAYTLVVESCTAANASYEATAVARYVAA